MSALIIWVDSQEAKLFNLLPTGLKTEKISLSTKLHPPEVHGKNHTREERDEGRFYHLLCTALEKNPATEWLVAGPGPGRKNFVGHLQKHHPNLMDYVKGEQTMDSLTDNQILAEGRKFFKHHHLFEHN
ncbi:MAG: hypothetical protein AB7O96_12315 [Pseudobdellovibrionaceae bacterium]